jgi:selenocysteine lyase/cysteine desulfurase
MNHAGVSPVSRRVAGAIERFGSEALHFNESVYRGWEEKIETARESIARLINAERSEIAFVRNTSEALSMVAQGLDWTPGDNIIALSDEYPANVYPWWGLRRRGVETRMLERPDSRFGVDNVAALVDDRSRLLAVSAVDWQTGFRADLRALGAFCRERGILFCVDAIQAVGAIRIDVKNTPVDFLAFGGHKWVMATEGCGALFVSQPALDKIYPPLLGWKSVKHSTQYLPYHLDLREDAARLEAGTLATPGILALGAAVDLQLEVGPARIEQRLLELTSLLGEELRGRGAELVSPWETGERSGIVTFRLGDPGTLVAAMKSENIIVRQRTRAVRLAPHFYNDERDIARVLSVVDRHV